MSLLENLGRNIRTLRVYKGFGSSEFANEIGITRGHLSNLEAGRINSNSEMLKNIADKLGVSVSDLYKEQLIEVAA